MSDEHDGMLREIEMVFNDPNRAPQEPMDWAESSHGYIGLSDAELIRTQIHLAPHQRKFLTERAAISGKSMALQIRELIEKEMNPQNIDWNQNPLLDDTAVDPEFVSSSTDSQNSDAAIYGSYQP